MPGDQHEIIWKGKVIRGFSKAMLRPMTPHEMRRQADATIRLIARCMTSATRDLVGVGAGSAWSPSGRSYWTLVKLQHGLPAISRQGLPAVTAKLGRPPADWSEFTRTLGDVRLDPDVEAKYRADFPRILENAQRCASVISCCACDSILPFREGDVMRRRSRIIDGSGAGTGDTMSSLERDILAYDREVARTIRRSVDHGIMDDPDVEATEGSGREEMTSHAGEHRLSSVSSTSRWRR